MTQTAQRADRHGQNKISVNLCEPSDPCAIYPRDLLLPRLISGKVAVAALEIATGEKS